MIEFACMLFCAFLLWVLLTNRVIIFHIRPREKNETKILHIHLR